MFNGWMDGLLAGLQTINNILTAGIAITAFSLFLYALSFNLRDRVARSFAIILLCVVVVFTTEALQNKTVPDWGIELLLRLQWVGIIFLPPSYLHLSDALLVTAGRPSRGRRRLAVRLVYVVSVVFLLLLIAGMLVGPLMPNGQPAPHLRRTAWTDFFTIYYMAIMVWAAGNFIRAFARMLTRSGQRRMLYLMAGATAPALGTSPAHEWIEISFPTCPGGVGWVYAANVQVSGALHPVELPPTPAPPPAPPRGAAGAAPA